MNNNGDLVVRAGGARVQVAAKYDYLASTSAAAAGLLLATGLSTYVDWSINQEAGAGYPSLDHCATGLPLDSPSKSSLWSRESKKLWAIQQPPHDTLYIIVILALTCLT